MSDVLQRLLADREWLMADGAMGTNLFHKGLETGDAPDLWNIDHPEKVTEVHQEFVDAGADIILTNTFGANALRLKLHNDQHRVHEINSAGGRLARAVADAAGRPVVVAGSMGPTGEIMEPVGALTAEDAEATFKEQAEALADGGADVLWIETMSSKEEYAAAVAGAATTGLPVIATMTFDTNGRTMMGVTPEDAAEFAGSLPEKVAAYGANCGVGPATLIDSLKGLKRAAGEADVIVAKANCGIPEYVEGEICYSGSPEVMATYAKFARDAGARIIGGCCGTTPVHLEALRESLEEHVQGATPADEAIETALGPIDQAKPQAENGGERRPRRRRRA